MESCNMPIKTNMKVTGWKDNALVKELMNTLMVILTQVNGNATQRMDMVFLRWQLGTDMKVIGLMARKMEKVNILIYTGKYCFTNGDLYEGNFNNGNR